MKKIIIAGLILCAAVLKANAATNTVHPVPYRTLYVGRNYLYTADDPASYRKYDPFIDYDYYLTKNGIKTGSVKLSGDASNPADLAYYFIVPAGQYQQMFVHHNVSEADFQKLKDGPDCQIMGNDPDLLKCFMKVTGFSGLSVQQPVIVSNRAHSLQPYELVNYSLNKGVDKYHPPVDYAAISAKPSDFPDGKTIPLVSLRDYFDDPNSDGLMFGLSALRFCEMNGAVVMADSATDGCAYPGVHLTGVMERGVSHTKYMKKIIPLGAKLYVNSVHQLTALPATQDSSLPTPQFVQARTNCLSAQGESSAHCGTVLSWDNNNMSSDEKMLIEVVSSSGKVVGNPVDVSGYQWTLSNEKLPFGGDYTVAMAVAKNGKTGRFIDAGDIKPPAAPTGFTVGEQQVAASSCGHSGPPTFYIGIAKSGTVSPSYPSGFTARAPYLYGKNLCPGVYQINVTATSGGASPTYAYSTFYVSVNAANPSLHDWTNSVGNSRGAPTTNVFTDYQTTSPKKPFIPVYTYSSFNAASQPSDFKADYAQYDKDIAYLQDDHTPHIQVSSAMVGLTTLEFNSSFGAWPLSADADDVSTDQRTDESYITPGVAFTTDLQQRGMSVSTAINNLLGSLSTSNVDVALDYDFSQPMRVLFFTMNHRQQVVMAQTLVSQVLLSKRVNGLNFDVEGGWNEPGAVNAYKLLADSLAYRDRWFGFYYFGDLWSPSLDSAMGPLGIGLISAYDTAFYRAPRTKLTSFFQWSQTPTIPRDGTWPTGSNPVTEDSGQNWPKADNDIFTNMQVDDAFAHSVAYNQVTSDAYKGCNSLDVPSHFSTLPSLPNLPNPSTYTQNFLTSPTGFCSLSASDSISENYRQLNSKLTTSVPTNTLVTARKAIDWYNLKFAPVLPIGASSTEWTTVEIWNPDFSAGFVNGDSLRGKRVHQEHNLQGSVPPYATIMMPGGKSACSKFTNSYLAEPSVQSDLASYDPNNPDAAGENSIDLMRCLNGQKLSAPGWVTLPDGPIVDSAHTPIPLQSFSSCGEYSPKAGDPLQPIPFSKCIMITGLPANIDPDPTVAAALNTTTLWPADAVQHLKGDTLDQLYDHSDSHLVGYALFALENSYVPGAYFAHVGTNQMVQEPWYVAGPALSSTLKLRTPPKNNTNYDPFYGNGNGANDGFAVNPAYKTLVGHIWQEIGVLQGSWQAGHPASSK